MAYAVTPDMTIGDLVKSGRYGEFARFFFTDMTLDHWNNSLGSYGFEKCGFEAALKRLEDMAASGKSYIHYIYSEEERLSEWDKEKVCLVHFPSASIDAPYALVIPGGGFNRQWGIIEGLSIADALNQLGVTAFVLFYRVKQEPVINKAIDDMHEAVRYIERNSAEFKVAKGKYIIVGFSAGATLASEMGSTNLGWKAAALPKPQMIFLGYPAVQHDASFSAYSGALEGSPIRQAMAPFLRRLGGPDFSRASIAPYNLPDYMDSSYPPCYITACEDDDTVPVKNSLFLLNKLNELGVPHMARIGKMGGHSFGLGIGLEVEGWLKEAIDFWKGL